MKSGQVARTDQWFCPVYMYQYFTSIKLFFSLFDTHGWNFTLWKVTASNHNYMSIVITLWFVCVRAAWSFLATCLKQSLLWQKSLNMKVFSTVFFFFASGVALVSLVALLFFWVSLSGLVCERIFDQIWCSATFGVRLVLGLIKDRIVIFSFMNSMWPP